MGLLYRDEASHVRLSHLRWHFVFSGSDEPTQEDLWLEPHFNDAVQESLAAFLIHRAEAQGRGEVPYSILHQGKSFNAIGEYIPAGVGRGLTCATYVLAAFEALEIPIIDLTSWPPGRPEDQQWFEEILRLLAELDPPAPAEHIAAQRAELPNVVRYRPEEVAAAFTTFSNRTLPFDEVAPPSVEILAVLNAPAGPLEGQNGEPI